MHDLAALLAPREVCLKGLGTFEVRQATVREAVLILGARDSSDADATARAVAAEWLSLRLFSALFSDVFTRQERRAVLEWLLTAGAPSPERVDEQLEEARQAARETSWPAVLADYRGCFRVSLQEALDEPWLLFLSHLYQMRRMYAEEALRNVRWYAGARTEGGLDGLYEAAGYDRSASQQYHREPMSEEEQAEILRRFQEVRGRRGKA